MPKKDNIVIAFGLLIIFVVVVSGIIVFAFGFNRLFIGEDEYKTEIIEIYDIKIVKNTFYLKTNSTIWPTDPMKVKLSSNNDLDQIIFAKIGDSLEMEYRLHKKLSGRATYHHVKITILSN